MRKISHFLFALLLLSNQVHAEAFKSPDILVDSKLDYDWSGLLVRKFRLLMKNYGVADPFKARVDESFILNEGLLKNYLSEESLQIVNDLGNVLGLNLPNMKTKVEMHGFSYEVQDFKTEIKGTEEYKDGLAVSSNFSASELSFTSDRITLSISIPAKDKKMVPVINIDIIRPLITAKQERLINFFTKIKIQDLNDSYGFQLQNADFEKMANGLVSYPEDINFNYDRIVVPKIALKIGSKKIEFSPEKIENLLRSKHEAIKGILIAQLATVLKEGTLQSTLKVVEKHKIPKEYWFDTKVMQSQMEIAKFASSIARNNVELRIPADFCTKKNYDQLKKECLNNKVTKTSDSRISKALHSQSLGNINELMESGEANIVASISEDYLNKLLVTTYDAGLWREELEEAGVELGPGKVVMRLDKRGDSGTLALDVIYKPSKLERFILGTKTIRFPLVLDISVRVEKHDEEPVVIVRLNDVDISDETLFNGRPDLGILSNIKDVSRLKNTVVKTIRKKVIALKDKDIIDLRYPEFRGLGLEKIDFLSDGKGRMNAMMRLEDLIEDEQNYFISE